MFLRNRTLTGGYNCPVTPMCLDPRNECDPNIQGECRQLATLGLTLGLATFVLFLSDTIPFVSTFRWHRCVRGHTTTTVFYQQFLYALNFFVSLSVLVAAAFLSSSAFFLLFHDVDSKVATLHDSMNATLLLVFLPRLVLAIAWRIVSWKMGERPPSPPLSTLVVIEIGLGFVPWTLFTRSHYSLLMVREIVSKAKVNTQRKLWCYMSVHTMWNVLSIVLIVLTLLQGMCHHLELLRIGFVTIAVVRGINVIAAVLSCGCHATKKNTNAPSNANEITTTDMGSKTNTETKSKTNTNEWTTSTRTCIAGQLLCTAVLTGLTMGPVYDELDISKVGDDTCQVHTLCFLFVSLTVGPLLAALCLAFNRMVVQCKCTKNMCAQGMVHREVEQEVQFHLMDILQWWRPPTQHRRRTSRDEVDTVAVGLSENDSGSGNALASNDDEEGWECSICLEHQLVDEECDRNAVQELFCTHQFHAECIRTWFQTEWTCPLCKDNVSKSALTCIVSLGDAKRVHLLPEREHVERNGRGRHVRDVVCGEDVEMVVVL